MQFLPVQATTVSGIKAVLEGAALVSDISSSMFTPLADLEMKLEESESEVSSSATSRTRQDLIYVPALDPDRDAEILTSGHLPSYLKESLRFERSTAVRFMNTLHKKLDRQTKRGN